MNPVFIIVILVVLLSVSIGGGIGAYFLIKQEEPKSKDNANLPDNSKLGDTDKLGDTNKPTPWISWKGYDYPGNDISGSPVTTEDECKSKCQSTTGCIAGLHSPNLKYCWLKSNLGPVNVDADRVLLIPPTTKKIKNWKMQKDTDHNGDDIWCYSDGSPLENCAAVCDNHPECKAYNRADPLLGGSWSKGGCCVKRLGTPVQSLKNVDLYSAA